MGRASGLKLQPVRGGSPAGWLILRWPSRPRPHSALLNPAVAAFRGLRFCWGCCSSQQLCLATLALPHHAPWDPVPGRPRSSGLLGLRALRPQPPGSGRTGTAEFLFSSHESSCLTCCCPASSKPGWVNKGPPGRCGSFFVVGGRQADMVFTLLDDWKKLKEE